MWLKESSVCVLVFLSFHRAERPESEFRDVDTLRGPHATSCRDVIRVLLSIMSIFAVCQPVHRTFHCIAHSCDLLLLPGMQTFEKNIACLPL